MLSQLLQPAFIIFGITLPLWIIFRLVIFAYNKRHQKPFSSKQEFILFLFYVYITGVLITTVVPLPMSRNVDVSVDRTNLTPIINTIKNFQRAKAVNDRTELFYLYENTIGNLILFIPLGMLLPFVIRKINSAKKVILVSFLFSFGIELVQFISRQFGTYRTADTDDVILNTLSGFLGFVMVYSCGCVKEPKSHQSIEHNAGKASAQ